MAKSQPETKPLIDFFLHLFHVQTYGEIKADDETKAILLSDPSASEKIFELKLRRGETEKSRRMSIRALGEKVESKSMCYKIIYDDMLVVKIPPKPIVNFRSYLKSIDQERTIASRISGSITCVFPNLSAILRKVPAARIPADTGPNEAEKAYVQRLKESPELQRYLKIGEGFVFFMNLSKYLFFNQVIESMHGGSDRVRKEILKNGPEAMSNLDVFESLYGAENDAAFFGLNSLSVEYERYIDALIRKYQKAVSIPTYQKNEWLYMGIAGAAPEIDPESTPPGFAKHVNTLITNLIKKHQKVVDQYRGTVRSVIKKKNYNVNRARGKGLITNVIGLLDRLKECTVSIRDLKPDNMFVARHLDGADHILANPEAYSLGLIDLETAVCFEPQGDEGIKQPLLAGTPSYATPSHLFSNRVLSSVYGDQLSRIFYMQDWYAGVGIIFNVVTGRQLFTRTARLIPEIIRVKRSARGDENQLTTVFKNISWRFWNSAIEEFNAKIRKYRPYFHAIDVKLPDHLAELLIEEAAMEQRLIGEQIKASLDVCRPLEKHRQQLLAAPSAVIMKSRKEWGKMQESGDIPAPVWEEISCLFKTIVPLKQQRENLTNTTRYLAETIPCDFLLSFLLDRVFYAMYRHEWTDREPPLSGCAPTSR